MKSPNNTYLLLDVRFKPARGYDGPGELFVPYFVIAREFEAKNLADAFEGAKRYRPYPIIEEKSSFWSRIEAAKAISLACTARNIYQGAAHGNHFAR